MSLDKGNNYLFIFMGDSNNLEDIFSGPILRNIGHNYRGVYLGATAPFFRNRGLRGDMYFTKAGNWTLVDKSNNFPQEFEEANDKFSHYRIVKFDLREVPRFSRHLNVGSFDIGVYSIDWSEDDSFARSANLLIRPGGLIMTHPGSAERIMRLFRRRYEYILRPECRKQGYTLLRKNNHLKKGDLHRR